MYSIFKIYLKIHLFVKINTMEPCTWFLVIILNGCVIVFQLIYCIKFVILRATEWKHKWHWAYILSRIYYWNFVKLLILVFFYFVHRIIQTCSNKRRGEGVACMLCLFCLYCMCVIWIKLNNFTTFQSIACRECLALVSTMLDFMVSNLARGEHFMFPVMVLLLFIC